jgi:hypothetical protein
VKSGLANFYGSYIEVNKELKKYPIALNYVVTHELGHKRGFDLAHEFDYRKGLLPLLCFTITHPSSWIDFLPVQRRKKIWIIDYNLMILYGLVILLSGILIKML